MVAGEIVDEHLKPDCLTCQAHQGLITLTNAPRILQTAHWRVEHAYPTSIKGWLVIVLNRHAEALHQLTPEEFASLATLFRVFSSALFNIVRSEKEYVMQFGEAQGHSHVHFHIIGRLREWPEELKGSNVFSALGSAVENPLGSDEVTELVQAIREYVLKEIDQL